MAAATAPVGLETTVSAKDMDPDKREQHTS